MGRDRSACALEVAPSKAADQSDAPPAPPEGRRHRVAPTPPTGRNPMTTQWNRWGNGGPNWLLRRHLCPETITITKTTNQQQPPSKTSAEVIIPVHEGGTPAGGLGSGAAPRATSKAELTDRGRTVDATAKCNAVTERGNASYPRGKQQRPKKYAGSASQL